MSPVCGSGGGILIADYAYQEKKFYGTSIIIIVNGVDSSISYSSIRHSNSCDGSIVNGTREVGDSLPGKG
jgi:hypothetical protein